MPLQKVFLAADVFDICLTHALSTEKEEIMGLLIGKIDANQKTSHISSCIIMARSDKQPDRVEISPEQLLAAATRAEELSKIHKQQLQVLGWYHSHPHITVWPSHVDLRTQAMYQNMDQMFVGLIFSVFPANSGSIVNEIQLTCFQTKQTETSCARLEIPIEIEPCALSLSCLETAITLPAILCNEEKDVSCKDQRDEPSDELEYLHNNALQTLELVHIMTKVAKPLFNTLEDRLSLYECRIQALKEEKEKILKELQNCS